MKCCQTLWQNNYSYNNSQIKLGNWVTSLSESKTEKNYEPLINMSPLDWFFMLVTKRINFESITEIIFSCSGFYTESYQYVWSHYLSSLSYHWKRKYDFKMKKRINSLNLEVPNIQWFSTISFRWKKFTFQSKSACRKFTTSSMMFYLDTKNTASSSG